MHVLLHSQPPALQQATPYPSLCWRVLDNHRQVWFSLLWGHCSFLLGPEHTRFIFCPSRVFFPVLCKVWLSMVRLMATSSKRTYAIPSLLHPSPFPCGSPLLTRTSTGDTQTQFCLSVCGVSGSWCAQGMSEPSEFLWGYGV